MIITIVILILIIVLAIFSYYKNSSSNEQKKSVTDKVNNTTDTNNTIEDTTNVEEDKPNNEDIVGKIKINGTNIDEYIVQGSDNDYYLNHNLNKEEDIAGAVFLDYRNNFNDRKLLIFGHNARTLKTVPFHDLEKYKDESFYNGNKYINLNLNNEDSKWIIFSVMLVKKDDNTHMKLIFSDSGWLQHLTWLKANSLYDTKVNVEFNDRIVIIQTCNYNPDDEYLLVSAKKI